MASFPVLVFDFFFFLFYMAESNFVDYVKSTAAPEREAAARYICVVKSIPPMEVPTVATVVEEVMSFCGETAITGRCFT